MKVGHFLWTSFLLIMSFDIMDGFVHPRNTIQPLSRNAPIVIADECIRLNQKLKEVRHNQAGIVLFDYKIENNSSHMSVETMKRIYQHSKSIADKLSYIQEKNVYRIINFSYERDRYMKVERRYNDDVQYINILRAFVTGMYLQEIPNATKINNTSSSILRSWNNIDKVNRIVENKYKIPLTSQFPQDLFFFSINNILYKGYMKRNDTMHNEYFDTSRHLLVFEDLYLHKHIPYIATIKNPIGIKITGKVQLKKIIEYLTVDLHTRDEIILIISFHRLISMRRLFPRLMKALQKKQLLDHNISICYEVNSYKKNMNDTPDDTDKEVDFIFKMKNKYDIRNNGFFFRFVISKDEVISC